MKNKRQLFSNLIIKFIPVQAKIRSIWLSTAIYCHYALNYFIINAAANTYFQNNQLIENSLPFTIIRIIFALLFVITKQPAFFSLNKVIIILQIVLISKASIIFQALALFIESLMIIVWSLTKQQRFIHFDSRLYIFKAFLKEIAIHGSIFVYWIFMNAGLSDDKSFFLLSCTAIIALIDYSQFYYYKKMQKILIQVDKILIIFIILILLHEKVIISYIQYLCFSGLTLVIIGFNIYTFKEDKKIENVNLRNLMTLEDQQKIQILIEIKRNIIKKNLKIIILLIKKFSDEIDNKQLQEPLQHLQSMNIDKAIDILNNYVFIKYKSMVEHSLILKDLVIYLYSPNPKILCLLSKDLFHHTREEKRIIYQDLKDNKLKVVDIEIFMDKIKDLIKNFIVNYEYLCEELMKERIKPLTISQKGLKLMKQLRKIQIQIAKNKNSNIFEISTLINRFILDCLPERYRSLAIPQRELSLQQKNTFAQILLGGQQDNQFDILSINLNFTKLFYLREQKIKGHSLKQMIPKIFIDSIKNQFKNIHDQIHINEQDAKFQRVLMLNSNGYALLCNYLLYERNHITGKAWKMLLKNDYIDKAFIIINSTGVLQEINELSFYYGFKKELKGLSLLPQLKEEILFNSYCIINKSTKLLASDDLTFSKDVILSIIQELKMHDSSLFVVQIKYTDLKTHNKIGLNQYKAEKVKDFQFFYDWHGKISTLQVKNDIEFNHQFSEQNRITSNFGENIIEMRYFDNRIDYKSNFDEERDCPSLPNRYESNSSNIPVQAFINKFDRDSTKMPWQFKVIFAIIVILCILTIGISTFYYTYYLNQAQVLKNSLQSMIKIHEKCQSVLKLAYLPTYNTYLNDIDKDILINQQIVTTNSISNAIFALGQNIFSTNTGKVILEYQDQLNLLINSYLLAQPSESYQKSLKLLVNNIYPSYQIFINEKISSYLEIDDKICTIVLIIVSIFIFGLLLVIFFLENRLQKRKTQILQILKFIKNDELQVMSRKILKFKETWIQNIDCHEIAQEDSPQQKNKQQQNNFNLSKHYISAIKIKKIYFLLIVWFICIFYNLLSLSQHISSLRVMSNNFIQLQNYNSYQILPLQSLWAAVNVEPRNVELVKSLITASFDEQYNKILKFRQLSVKNQLSNRFKKSYTNFWQKPKFCSYINDTQCPKISYEDLREGGNMLISFLLRNLQIYTTTFQMPIRNTATETNTIIIAKYILKYLSQFIKVNDKFISDEYTFQQLIKNQTYLLLYIGAMFTSLLIVPFVFYYRQIKKQYKHFEQLLIIVPFDNIKNIQAFQTYFRKYYIQE